MNEQKPQELSADGHIRKEEILQHVLQISHARRNRRRLYMVAIVVVALGFGGVAWRQLGNRNMEIIDAHLASQPHGNKTKLESSDPPRYPHLDVEIVSAGQPLSLSPGSHRAIELESISDEQLISQLADAKLPFGLLFADDEVRLLPHAGFQARRR